MTARLTAYSALMAFGLAALVAAVVTTDWVVGLLGVGAIFWAPVCFIVQGSGEPPFREPTPRERAVERTISWAVMALLILALLVWAVSQAPSVQVGPPSPTSAGWVGS